jgi:hypothetical protein
MLETSSFHLVFALFEVTLFDGPFLFTGDFLYLVPVFFIIKTRGPAWQKPAIALSVMLTSRNFKLVTGIFAW